LLLVIDLGPEGMPNRFGGPLHERLPEELGTLETPGHQAFFPLRSVTGAMPAYFCSAAAEGYRSRCSPKATKRRDAKTGSAPGRACNKGKSGCRWACCAMA